MPPTPRPELWSAQLYAKVYGITSHAAGGSSTSVAKDSGARSCNSSTATTAGNSSSSSKSATASSTAQQQKRARQAVRGLDSAFAAMSVAGSRVAQHEGRTKTQKRNAKRREKQKQERALAAAAAGADASDVQGVPDQQQHVAQQRGLRSLCMVQ
jgi:hypothetical protein